MDDYISKQAAIDVAIDIDYENRGILKESRCKEIENRINMIPSADVVSRSQLIETIKHYAQYPDGIQKLLAVYAESRKE